MFKVDTLKDEIINTSKTENITDKLRDRAIIAIKEIPLIQMTLDCTVEYKDDVFIFHTSRNTTIEVSENETYMYSYSKGQLIHANKVNY